MAQRKIKTAKTQKSAEILRTMPEVDELKVEPPEETPEEKLKNELLLEIHKARDSVRFWVLIIGVLVVAAVALVVNAQQSEIDSIRVAQGNLLSNIIQVGYSVSQSAQSSMPFCYGYDSSGNKGFGIDPSKVTTPCPVTTTSTK